MDLATEHSGSTTTNLNPQQFLRLVGAVLAEQNDEWADGRRHLGLDVLAKSRLTLITGADPEEDSTTAGTISA